MSLLLCGGFMCLSIWQVINFVDMEADYMNPIELCQSLNAWVVPEVMAHGTLTLLFLLTGEWACFLVNVPLLAWNGYKISQKRHLYDPTVVFRHLSEYKREGFIKVGFFFFSFFFYLYCMISSLIEA
ncbi:hypothetical protein IWQ60_011494 [Tieghemiomyces parasiticus]|nr:hypothetical protein IWQ60_011494 [Tieghemiomyces parasiticus]